MSQTSQIARRPFYTTKLYLVVLAVAMVAVIVMALVLPGEHVVARELPNGQWVNAHGQPIKTPSGY